MNTLVEDIIDFLRSNGFECELLDRMGQEVIFVRCGGEVSSAVRCIVPQEVCAESMCEAKEQAEQLRLLLNSLEEDNLEAIVITEDRWRNQGNMMRARLLAHLERFASLYARNCKVQKIDKETAAAFLGQNHSYGDAACRYRYGLYLKRCTGKKAEISLAGAQATSSMTRLALLARNDSGDGILVAVATFSNARKWQKGDKRIRSYEWTRYASLPGVRISGGMGKVLKAFIKDVQPDDIMSYADLEWSEGKVYEQLGFVLEGKKDPVMFSVDGQWHRSALKQQSGLCMTVVDMPPTARGCRSGAKTGVNESHAQTTDRFFQNLGSNKYRLKLTPYE